MVFKINKRMKILTKLIDTFNTFLAQNDNDYRDDHKISH